PYRTPARRVGHRLQHQEDRWVRMIVADRADRVEAAQIIFVRRAIAVPRDDVERRMTDFGTPQIAHELRDELKRAAAVFVRRSGRLEVAGIGEAVRSD